MRLLRIVLAAALLTAAVPTVAQAGSYTVYTCRSPTGGAGVGQWRITSHDRSVDTTANHCPGGPFEVLMADGRAHDADDIIEATFTAPADTSIPAYTLFRTATLGSAYNYRYYEVTGAGASVRYDTCYGGCLTMGSASTPFGGASVVSVSGRSDVHALVLALTCGNDDTESSPCAAAKPAAHLDLYRADVTLEDDFAPVISSPPTGPLVSSSGPLTGVAPVSIAATDRGGGVYQALFEVDGAVVQSQTLDSNGGACAPPFAAAVPCKLSASATLGFDTSKIADGAHSLRILVTDATGNNAAAYGPITIRTANSACNPASPVKAFDLRVGVARGHGKKRRLVHSVTGAFGHKVRLTGRLQGAGGAPVAGVPLCVAAEDDATDATLSQRATVTTGADGRFSYVANAGPSRRLYFVYRTPSGPVIGTVMVHMRARTALTGSPHSIRTGQSVGFRGKLRGGHVPRRGVLVEMQGRRATGWQTIGTTRTDSHGRFHYRYRFVRTLGVQRYSLRARIPRQNDYPYAAGSSPAVHVRVAQ